MLHKYLAQKRFARSLSGHQGTCAPFQDLTVCPIQFRPWKKATVPCWPNLYRFELKFYATLAPYMPIVWLNESNNFDWVFQSICVLSVQCSGGSNGKTPAFLSWTLNAEPLNTRITWGVETMINVDSKVEENFKYIWLGTSKLDAALLH